MNEKEMTEAWLDQVEKTVEYQELVTVLNTIQTANVQLNTFFDEKQIDAVSVLIFQSSSTLLEFLEEKDEMRPSKIATLAMAAGILLGLSIPEEFKAQVQT